MQLNVRRVFFMVLISLNTIFRLDAANKIIRKMTGF